MTPDPKIAAQLAIDSMVQRCEEDLQKAHLPEGVHMIINDYHIWAQKHLLTLGLPVDHFLKQVSQMKAARLEQL